MKKEWFKIIKNSTGGVPEIYVYGILTPFGDDDDGTVSYSDFQAAFRALEPYTASCNIRINCLGGSVMEGLAIYDMIRTSAMKVTTICEGVAASMGGILFEAGDTRIMYPNSRLMIHRAQGAIVGDADSIRAYADQVQSCEDSIRAILIDRTGLSEKDVNALMQTNVDTWITADDAVNKYHLADSIQASAKTVSLNPQNFAGKKPEQLYKLFQNVLTIKNSMDKLKATLIVLLGTMGISLSASDSEDKFVEEVNKAFKAKDDAVSNQKKENAEAIVAQAILDGKLKEEEKAPFVAVGTNNTAMLVTMLAKIGAPAPVSATAAGGTTTIVNLNGNLSKDKTVEETDDRAKWTYFDWSKNDPTALAVMETADPEKFNKLVAMVSANAKTKGYIA